ncbi:MAG TPA: helix-turn-helix domain-containing protein [Puia sp.]|nr:helix-turn-helix domain-containing protein [Puia sp.]
MPGADSSNHIFQMAVQFVNQTNKHIFLTGKAGTGKTTFLKYIKENSFKKTAVVAPTGVAAINAGGVTMHSFFQLPFGPFVPSQTNEWNSPVTNRHNLFKNIRFNHNKRELLRELELLIIDEISMVRADMLDAVDTILRHFRQQPLLPFGGLQVLYIGDLFQLPPVVNNDEWEKILKIHYSSPFFFDALVVKESPPVLIELKKIYRQNEAGFISILNNIRDKKTTVRDLEQLHQHYNPGFHPPENDHYITLTTHNTKAHEINQQKLRKLTGKLFEFKGELTGDFNEKSLPAAMLLQLKVGSQIMFIKNDKGEFRRYYNGKIGTISKIETDKIFVQFPGPKNEMEIEKETWKNVRYNYNSEKDFVDEEELGTFKQYPICLAWAITIHKSQGLTFEKAIIDAGDSFAPGQVYVALSRLISLEGLVLRSRIHPQSITTDERVLAFSKSEMAEDFLELELKREQQIFVSRSMLQSFSMEKSVQRFQEHRDEYEHRTIPDKGAAFIWAKNQLDNLVQLQGVAVKFTRQLERVLTNTEQDGYAHLHERINKGFEHFYSTLNEILASLKKHIRDVSIKPRVKKYVAELHVLQILIERKLKQLQQTVQIAEALMKGMDTNALLTLVEQSRRLPVAGNPAEEERPAILKKGETRFTSLALFKQGLSLAEIATMRSLTSPTIENHLASFIPTGEIKIEEIVPEKKIEIISKIIDQHPAASPSYIKEKLGIDYSYTAIKAVMVWKGAGTEKTHPQRQR